MIKPIKDFQGYYITENGDVFSELGKGNRDKQKTVKLYKLHPRKAQNGYLRVCMRQQSTNKRAERYVHRLVAENFIANPFKFNIVNHLDFNKENNNYFNLEWTDYKGNNEYSMKFGHLKRNDKGKFYS